MRFPRAFPVFIRIIALCCVLSLLILSPVFAQSSGRRMLRGSVVMSGETPQAYIIYFTVNGNKISGKSITGQHSGQPLTAAITGQFNADGTEMYLKETHSLDPRGLNGFTYYCFFTARLKLSRQGNRRIWTGQFISTAEDGGPCGGGTMRFEDLPAPPENPPPQRPAPRPAPQPRPTPPPPAPPRPQPRPVVPRDTPKPAPVVVDTPKPAPPPAIPLPDTTGLKPLYTWTNDTLGIEIWDGWQEDGDVVSILFNGREIMPRQTLSRDKKLRFSMPLSERSVDTVQIVMHGEGTEKPCTPRITIFDGTGQRDLDIAGAAGQTAILYFKRWK